jgi:hypothetical protein
METEVNFMEVAEADAKAQAAEAARVAEARSVADVTALDRAFQATTAQGAGAMRGGEMLPRRRLKFRLDTSECLPGVFDVPTLEITLQTLTAAEEMQVMAAAADSAGRAIHLYARSALAAVNGAPLSAAHREWFWEAIGMAGRQLVVFNYAQIGSPSPAAQGKALSTATVG